MQFIAKMARIRDFVLSAFLITFQVYHGNGQFIPQSTTVTSSSIGPPTGQFILPAVIEPCVRPCSTPNPYPPCPNYNDFYIPPPQPQQIIILDDGNNRNKNGIDDILLLFILASKNRRGGGLFGGGCGGGCGNYGCGGCSGGCEGGCYSGNQPASPITLVISSAAGDADTS
ncbi:uncharacterized protein LOC128672402 [Plodia interpunctella]|uniref:uncharacterized protein LOC128672402 n=1 Tax=Plodia interpunctella TaxID=58824 RepID=UPI0023687B37|nr:uncharacterized protein LOC128672402 [Plodia interpunctella]